MAAQASDYVVNHWVRYAVLWKLECFDFDLNGRSYKKLRHLVLLSSSSLFTAHRFNL